MRSRTESCNRHAVVERDLHGIDGDDAALGNGLGGFAFQRLGLVLGLGELGARQAPRPSRRRGRGRRRCRR